MTSSPQTLILVEDEISKLYLETLNGQLTGQGLAMSQRDLRFEVFKTDDQFKDTLIDDQVKPLLEKITASLQKEDQKKVKQIRKVLEFDQSKIYNQLRWIREFKPTLAQSINKIFELIECEKISKFSNVGNRELMRIFLQKTNGFPQVVSRNFTFGVSSQKSNLYSKHVAHLNRPIYFIFLTL